MYLQITTRCNMKCPHCCYSCRPGAGKHMEYAIAIDAINFALDHTECITIGGGEPTLHPKFFDILRTCLDSFDYVWMATNGSNIKAMRRLANIIDGNDYESFDIENYCTCSKQVERENCDCYPEDTIHQEDKLSVALSQDWAHDDIDQWVVDYWTRRSKHQYSHFEIRNVFASSAGATSQGRAKKTGSGTGDHCPCDSIIIKPSGKLKLCGCTNSPTIGDIWQGILPKWQKFMELDRYRDCECWNKSK